MVNLFCAARGRQVVGRRIHRPPSYTPQKNCRCRLLVPEGFAKHLPNIATCFGFASSDIDGCSWVCFGTTGHLSRWKREPGLRRPNVKSTRSKKNHHQWQAVRTTHEVAFTTQPFSQTKAPQPALAHKSRHQSIVTANELVRHRLLAICPAPGHT